MSEAEASGGQTRYPRNYRLFKLRKVLSVAQDPSPHLQHTAQLSIAAVAIGAGLGFRLVATALSNGNFVFCFEADGRVPQTHAMEWHREPGRMVSAMCLDPSAKVLLCATLDANVFLIPAHHLITARSDSEASLSELAKVGSSPLGGTMLRMHCERDASRMLQLSPKKGRVVQCLWWNAWDNQALGILGFESGHIEVVALSELELARSLKVRAQLTRLELVADPLGQYAYVLLHSAQHGVFQLTLGLQLGHRGFQTLLSHPQDPCFNPLWVSGEKAQLGAQAIVSVQHAPQGPLIGALRRADMHTSRLEVFDPELSSSFALYEYQLFPSVSLVQMADSFLFVVSGAHKLRFSVVSRLLAERSEQREAHPSEACMQQFQMEPGQGIRGLVHCPGSQCAEAGVFLWSGDCVYQCCPDMRPEELFVELVTSGLERNHAEPLGQTLELDVLALYGQVAEQHFEAGQYSRAISILALSDLPMELVLRKFGAVGQLGAVQGFLRSQVHTQGRTPRACTMLLCVQLCLLLHPEHSQDQQLKAAVQATVSDPDVPLQLPQVLRFAARTAEPWVVLQLGWCHARLGEALQELAEAVRTLQPSEVQLVLTWPEPAPSSCVREASFFARCLSPGQQLKVVLASPGALVLGFVQLPRLLELLGEQAALEVFQKLSPGAELVREAIGRGEAPARLPSELTEVFLRAAIRLLGREGCWREHQVLEALWRHLGSYRAPVLAAEAKAVGAWRVAGAAFEHVHRFGESLVCLAQAVLPELLALQQEGGSAPEALELCAPMAAVLLKAIGQQQPGLQSVHGSPLGHLLQLWATEGLPGEWLEQLLQANIQGITPALGQLEASSLPCSPELRAKATVARVKLAMEQLGAAGEQGHHQGLARLLAVLEEQLGGTESALVHCVPPQASEVVLFTCGHLFERALYQEAVLPAYRPKLLEVLPEPSRELLEALTLDADIQDGRCCSACPVCVVRHLRDLRLAEDPRAPVPVWRMEDALEPVRGPRSGSVISMAGSSN